MRNRLPELCSLDFIREGKNIIMTGNPGTGKTHTAIGLGIKACGQGYCVLYTTIPYLVTELKESNNEYWLERDAALRTDFNIKSGFQTSS